MAGCRIRGTSVGIRIGNRPKWVPADPDPGEILPGILCFLGFSGVFFSRKKYLLGSPYQEKLSSIIRSLNIGKEFTLFIMEFVKTL